MLSQFTRIWANFKIGLPQHTLFAHIRVIRG
jgi:hypothetical protein